MAKKKSKAVWVKLQISEENAAFAEAGWAKCPPDRVFLALTGICRAAGAIPGARSGECGASPYPRRKRPGQCYADVQRSRGEQRHHRLLISEEHYVKQ